MAPQASQKGTLIMSDLKYAWLQETLAELIHHTTEAKLHSVSKHLHTALREVQQADTGIAPRSVPIEIATMRMARLPGAQEEALGDNARRCKKGHSPH